MAGVPCHTDSFRKCGEDGHNATGQERLVGTLLGARGTVCQTFALESFPAAAAEPAAAASRTLLLESPRLMA